VRKKRREHVQPAEDDLAKLLRAIVDHPLEALVWIGLGAGLRRGEVAALQWTDITYPSQGLGTLRAHRRVNRVTARAQELLKLDGGRLEREGLKSQKERRIHFGGLMLEVLQRRLKHQLAQRLQAGQAWRGPDYQAGTPSGYIFTTTVGTPRKSTR
jgi:integrase